MNEIELTNLKASLLKLGIEIQKQLLALTNQYKYTGRLGESLNNTTNVQIKDKMSNGINNPYISLKVDKHLEYIAYGRKKGKMPPIQPIRSWVASKIEPEQSKLNNVAYAIATNIMKKGIRPKLGKEGEIINIARQAAYDKQKEDIKNSISKDLQVQTIAELKKALIEAKLTT
jgi:hypothetical protein